MSMSDNISCFIQTPKNTLFGNPIEQSRIKPKSHIPSKKPVMPTVEKAEYVPYKMIYNGKESYHFPAGPSHTSPCMNPYWIAQPIRKGKVRDDIDRD